MFDGSKMDNRPDYIIIGAMKCGTSTLAAQLGAQPGMFMTTPKEPNFFSDDAVFANGMAWYASLFEPAAPGDMKGEASTHYTKLPDLPHALPRLADALPTPKLIYLIRNPVERAISHYMHEWSIGTIKTPLDEALHTFPALINYGVYGMQIAPWVERFGADAIHVDTLEAMKADPQGLLDRVGRFLGRDGLHWIDELNRMNVSVERWRRLPLERHLVHSRPATWVRRNFVPQSLRDWIKSRRRIDVRPILSGEERRRIEAVFADDRQRMHALFPGRPDLDAAWRFSAQGRPKAS